AGDCTVLELADQTLEQVSQLAQQRWNMRSVCVFCGSSGGGQEIYAREARRLGQALAGRGLRLVYGGGHVGLMGVLADAVLEAGGRVIGVIPEALLAKELAHRQLTELHVVSTMHQR